jgi:hypothetical protein
MAAVAAAPSAGQSIAARMNPASINGTGKLSDPGLQSTEHVVADFDGNASLQIDGSHSSGFGYFKAARSVWPLPQKATIVSIWRSGLGGRRFSIFGATQAAKMSWGA